MSTITLPQIEAAYQTAVNVYEGHITASDGAKALHQEYALNRNTAKDLIGIYKNLVDGKKFERTMSEMASDFYLNSILKDKGRGVAIKATRATWLHIEY